MSDFLDSDNKTAPKLNNFVQFVGTSKAMMSVYEKISQYAPTTVPVVIEGETGTGKNTCAEALHEYSDRNSKPFVTINIAAISPEMIESTLFGHVKGAFTGADKERKGAISNAEGGTLFLDEIGDLSLELQIKLLNFCDKKSYSKLGSDLVKHSNVRLIFASNKNLKQQVRQQSFREDLYYRINVANIKMPALRARSEDILDLAYFYLKIHSQTFNKGCISFSEAAEQALLQYGWPGNIRELSNLVQSLALNNNTKLILKEALPPHIVEVITHPQNKNLSQASLSLPLWKIERRAILQAMHMANGNVTVAASILEVAPSTIYRKFKLWEIN